MEIDLNVRIGKNWTVTGMENADGPVERYQVVEVFESESNLFGPGTVEGVDEERQLIYLSIDWTKLHPLTAL